MHFPHRLQILSPSIPISWPWDVTVPGLAAMPRRARAREKFSSAPPTPALHILRTFNWLQLLTSTDTGNLPVRKIMNRFNTNSARKQTRLPAPLRPPGARRRCSRRGSPRWGPGVGEPSIPTGPRVSTSPRGPHIPPEWYPHPQASPEHPLRCRAQALWGGCSASSPLMQG